MQPAQAQNTSTAPKHECATLAKKTGLTVRCVEIKAQAALVMAPHLTAGGLGLTHDVDQTSLPGEQQLG